MRPLTSREQNIFALCLLLVTLYVGYQLVMMPLREKTSALEQRIETQEKKLSKYYKVIQNASSLEGDYQQLMDKFKQGKSNEQVMSSILAEIENVAGQLKLPISDLKPKIVNKEEYVNRFSVSLTIEGEFVTIIQFIHTLQLDPHFFKVDELRFDNNTQRGNRSVRTNLVLSKILIP